MKWQPREICFIPIEKIDQRKYAHWLLKNQLDRGPAVHTVPEEFENGALFLRLGLPSTLIRRNRPPKTELFKNTLENRRIWKPSFSTRWRHDNQVICLPEFSSNTNPKLREKMAGTTTRLAKLVQLKPCYSHAHGCTQAFLSPVIVAFSYFSDVVWTENILSLFLVCTKNIWCVFRVKPPFSNSSGVVWTGPTSLPNLLVN